MSDDRPSIAELKRMATYPGNPAQQSVLLRADVFLVFLEIAAAALALQDWHDGDDRSEARLHEILDAIPSTTRKVRQ